MRKHGILVISFGLADDDDLLSGKARKNFFNLYDEEQPDAVFMPPECKKWPTATNMNKNNSNDWNTS